MPLCVYCNEPLKCHCSSETQPIGQSIVNCPVKVPGKLWIHVTDDVGNDINEAAVKGASATTTDSFGLARFDPLAPGDYDAELLVPLSKGLSPAYDAPAEAAQRRKRVTVSQGVLAYVLFTLTRKSKLKADFVYVADRTKSTVAEPFKLSGLKLKAAGSRATFEPATDTGAIEIDLPAGAYDLTPDYTAVDATEFDFLNETRKAVDLPPGGSKSLVFELVRKAKLKVEIVFKRYPGKTDKKECLVDAVVDVTADFQGNAYRPAGKRMVATDKGVADFGSVPAGKYTLTPDYSKVPTSLIDGTKGAFDVELLPGESRTVEIEVEPLYQTVQLIAHCLLTVPDLVYRPHATEKMVPTGTTDPEEPTHKIDGLDFESDYPGQASDYHGEWKGSYHGLANERGDMDARVKFLEYTLGEAHGKADHGRTNLKVFMIPECYFQGLYGAYLFENVGYLFDKLKTLASDEKWTDWLLVLGTVNCIDTGISVVDPNTKTTGGTGIPQMMNYSPVLRGGVAAGGKGGGSQTDPQFRLIQKLLNSAELLNAEDLIPHHGYDANVRKIAVNEDVQFQGTQNEDKVAAVLSRIIDEKDKDYDPQAKSIFCTQFGLPDDHWKELLKAVRDDVRAQGIARVVRSIRTCNIGGKPDDLTQWGYSGFVDKSKAHLDANQTLLSDARPVLLGSLSAQWEKDYKSNPTPTQRVPEFTQKNWTAVVGSERLDRMLKAVKADAESGGVPLAYQKERLLGLVVGLIRTNSAVTAFFVSSPLKALMEETWARDYVDNPPPKPRYGKAPAPLPFGLESWTTLMDQEDKTRIQRIHDGVRAGMDGEASRRGCPKSDLERELDQLLQNRKVTGEFVDSVPAPKTFGLSIHPVWKKFLELYCKTKPVAGVALTQSKEEMDYRDFCFAGVRKAGPFMTWEDAEPLPVHKKLIFGLEICADHAAGRLKNALSSGTKPAIDIQLVPSAGMSLGPEAIAARAGGYAFNCDGWNGRVGDYKDKAGTYIKVWFNGPKCEGKNPVTPHSAIGKGGGGDLSRKGFKAAGSKLDDGKAGSLFAKGAGELHVYEKQKLPT
jgi:hypothetical protein